MTDSLSWLIYAHQQSVRKIQSSEKKNIGPFLMGEWVRSSSFCLTETPLRAAPFRTFCSTSSVSPYSTSLLPPPCFDVHGLIPLAIVSESIFSLSTASTRESVRSYFKRRGAHRCTEEGSGGFQEVFMLYLGDPLTTGGDGGMTEARHGCIASLKAVVEEAVGLARCTDGESPMATGSRRGTIGETMRRKRGRSEKCRPQAYESMKARLSHSSLFRRENLFETLPPTLSFVTSHIAREKREAELLSHCFLIAVCCNMDFLESVSGKGLAARAQNRGILERFLADVIGVYQTACARLEHVHATARQNGKEGATHRIHIAVMLVPNEEVHRGALEKLSERLEAKFGTELVIECFNGDQQEKVSRKVSKAFSVQNDQREDGVEAYGDLDGLRVLQWWEPMATTTVKGCSVLSNQQTERKPGMECQETSLLFSDSRFFFTRSSHLPFTWFFYFALQLFPLLLPPQCLQNFQTLWTSRRSIQDVLYAFHSIAMPFSLSHCNAAIRDRYKSAKCLLNSLYLAAAELAHHTSRERKSSGSSSGHMEAVYFMLLYEDLVNRRPNHLLRLPGVVNELAALENGSNRQPEVPSVDGKATCGKGIQQSRAARVLRDAEVLPFVTCTDDLVANVVHYGGMPPPPRCELRRVARLAALPPFTSAAEQLTAVQYYIGLQETRESLSSFLTRSSDVSSLSANNFFGPSLTQEVQMLHLLTCGACDHSSSVKGGDASIALNRLQAVTLLSDERLLCSLEVLRLSGLGGICPQDLTADTSLTLPDMV